MRALRHVLTTYGLPGALYTDRAHWAVHTPTSGTGRRVLPTRPSSPTRDGGARSEVAPPGEMLEDLRPDELVDRDPEVARGPERGARALRDLE